MTLEKLSIEFKELLSGAKEGHYCEKNGGKVPFKITFLDFNPENRIFMAKGEDREGESAIIGYLFGSGNIYFDKIYKEEITHFTEGLKGITNNKHYKTFNYEGVYSGEINEGEFLYGEWKDPENPGTGGHWSIKL